MKEGMGGEPGSRGAGGAKPSDEERLRAALRRAKDSPADDAAWSDAEAIAVELQRAEEAAGVAKDFVGDIDRAVGYLEQLFRAKPTDAQVAASLERLLERQGAWEALGRVWQTRLGFLTGAEARDLRERAAALYLDRLGDTERALGEAKRLLESGGDDVVPCGILERILSNDDAPVPVRSRALALLRAQHEKMGREGRIVDA